jgi:hypothetical protein
VSATGGGGTGGKGGGGAFGGGDYIRDQFPDTYEGYLAKKAGKEGTAGGKLVTYDNEIGEVTLRLPPQYVQHSAELLEELYEQFFGAPAGDPKVQEEMNLFVAEWLKKKDEGGVESQSL